MNSVPTNLWEWLSTIGPHERLALTIVIFVLSLVASVIVAGIVALTVRGIHKRNLDVALKRELLDRGLAAEEIAMIVRATPTKGKALP